MLARLSSAACVVLMAGSVLVTGCTDSGKGEAPKLAPVSGKVLYKGKPVEGASVTFQAQAAPRAAIGTTNAQGEFQLTMFNTNDGATVGDNVVTVSKEVAGEVTDSAESVTQAYGQYAKNKQAGVAPPAGLPEKYKDPAKSPLKNYVKAGEKNNFIIELTD